MSPALLLTGLANDCECKSPCGGVDAIARDESLLVQDLMLSRLVSQWEAAGEVVPLLSSTCRLLKGWARAQGLTRVPDAVDGTFLSVFLIFLVETGTLVRAPLRHIRILVKDWPRMEFKIAHHCTSYTLYISISVHVGR